MTHITVCTVVVVSSYTYNTHMSKKHTDPHTRYWVMYIQIQYKYELLI